MQTREIGQEDTAILNEILALLDQAGRQLDATDRVRGHDPWGAIAGLEAEIRRLARGLSGPFCMAHAGLAQRLLLAEGLHLVWWSLHDQIEEAMRPRKRAGP